MSFEKGKPKTGGRQPGSPNKFTGTFRDAVQAVYRGLGGHSAFLAWARGNRSEFYRIASRLIPVEREDDTEKTVTLIIQRFTPEATVEQPTLPAPSEEHRGG